MTKPPNVARRASSSKGYGVNEHGLRMVYQTTGGLIAGHTFLSLEKPGGDRSGRPVPKDSRAESRR